MAQRKKQFTSPFLAGDRHGHLHKDRLQKKRRHRRPAPAEPAMTRSGLLAHPGTLLMGGAGVLFLAYVLNVAGLRTMADDLFSGLDRRAHAHTADVASLYLSLLPLVGLLLAAFLLWLVFSNLGNGSPKRKGSPRAHHDDEMTIHQFAAEALAHGIGVEVAREIFRMLQPAYTSRLRTALHQSLARNLGQDPMDVEDLYRRMLRATGCGELRAGSHGEADTLIELLQAVQRHKHGKLLEVTTAPRNTAPLPTPDAATTEPATAQPATAQPATIQPAPAQLGPTPLLATPLLATQVAGSAAPLTSADALAHAQALLAAQTEALARVHALVEAQARMHAQPVIQPLSQSQPATQPLAHNQPAMPSQPLAHTQTVGKPASTKRPKGHSWIRPAQLTVPDQGRVIHVGP